MTHDGRSSSFPLPPREKPCRFALPVSTGSTQSGDISLKVDWHGDYPLDQIAVLCKAEEYVPVNAPVEPVAVELIRADGKASGTTAGFPYRLTSGDRLIMEFEPGIGGADRLVAAVVSLSGYYVTPSAGAQAEQVLALRFTSSVPCGNDGLAGEFTLATPGKVSLLVYDVRGRQVRRVVKTYLEAGTHSFRWDLRDESGRRIGPGVYFARLVTEETHTVRKVLVEK